MRKFIKVSVITLVLLAIVVLGGLATFLSFNPFEGSLAVMPDVVPRRIDFFVRKPNLAGDFAGAHEAFPEPPAVQELLQQPEWQKLARGPLWRSLRKAGIETAVAEARKTYKQLSENWIDLVRDVVGQDVQVAGRIDRGSQRVTWCSYLRVGWRIRAGYGLLDYDSTKEQMRTNGIVVQKDGDFYQLKMRDGSTVYLVRHLDCLMLANDRRLLDESYQLAKGAAREPFGTSSPFQDNVVKPIREWETRTGQIESANSLQFYLQPRQVLSLSPAWARWPNPKAPENRTERVFSSFLNLESWRFLSGSLIFEPPNEELPASMTLLADLVVDNTKFNRFQKDFFRPEREKREKWMNDFFSMVPKNACAAAALRMPAGQFLKEMFEQALQPDEKQALNELLQGTGLYKSVPELIDKVQLSFLPRVGIVFNRNLRSKDSKEKFPVQEDAGWPQYAWVFYINSAVGKLPVQRFTKMLNEHRGTFGFTNAYELKLTDSGPNDVALEFAHSMIPGTGSLAVCTYGDFFIISNYGPLINRMINTRLSSAAKPMHRTDAFTVFDDELLDAVNGLVYINGAEWQDVFGDVLKRAEKSKGAMDAVWAIERRPAAEQVVFERGYKTFGAISKIPSSRKQQFNKDVDRELAQMWQQQKEKFGAAERAQLQQAQAVFEAMESAYFQVVLDPNSLRLAGRVLTRR